MQVRLVPMSKNDPNMKGKTIEEIQMDFFENYLKNNESDDYKGYRFKSPMKVNPGDLFLFQLDGNVIASAMLENVIDYDVIDSDGYIGQYDFKVPTIRTFLPISACEMKQLAADFNGFNQSSQYVTINKFKKLLDRIEIKNKPSRTLERYERYSRKEIHDLFSPNTSFTPGAGMWGISGIIRVPDTISDYIFIVTYGQSQSGHEFVEGIDDNGILEWQSQPSQTLNDSRIIDFINHDYTKSNIYLFLRENKNLDYSYLGKLAYISHDNQRECPVYFQWQILDWNSNSGKISLDKSILDKQELVNRIKENNNDADLDSINSNEFIISIREDDNCYKNIERKGRSTSEFTNRKVDFEGDTDRNKKLGNKGEDIVVDYEKKKLIEAGRNDLAEQVMATRKFAGNAEKFDVLSYEIDGSKKYIEVKTTTGSLNSAFHISENEVWFSEQPDFKDHYYLYRLYNFNKREKKADMKIIKGSISRGKLVPTNYICRIGSKNENV